MDETTEPHFPFDVWVGHIIPFLKARDVLALACVNRIFYGFVRALPRHSISTGCVHDSSLENCFNLVEFQAKHPFLQMKINLMHCSLRTPDISAIGSVHTLTLDLCRGITDVRALGSVHTLTLDCCNGITDVSALGSVHTLKIVYCSRVRDVSALGSVHTLKIVDCSRVRDVSALGSVHTLKLWYCNGITDVSALGTVHTVTLRSCYAKIGRAHV